MGLSYVGRLSIRQTTRQYRAWQGNRREGGKEAPSGCKWCSSSLHFTEHCTTGNEQGRPETSRATSYTTGMELWGSEQGCRMQGA